jgi:hypothetical protein
MNRLKRTDYTTRAQNRIAITCQEQAWLVSSSATSSSCNKKKPLFFSGRQMEQKQKKKSYFVGFANHFLAFFFLG